MSPLFLGFLGVSFLVLATPGPDTALTVRNALLGGRRGGVFTAAGIVAGQAIWVLATSVGLVAVVAACEPVFEAIKWLGSAYLVWLGATGLWAAWRGKMPALAAGAGAVPASRLSSASAFRQGLLSDLGNPKMAVFFSSLLPQFASEATFTSLALLGLVFCAMTFTWLAGYAMLLSLVGDYVRRRSVWRTIEAITGAALVALGLKLAAEQR